MKKKFPFAFLSIIVLGGCNSNDATIQKLERAQQQIDSLNNELITCSKELEATKKQAIFHLEQFQKLQAESK